MSSTTSYRLSGIALLIGAALSIVGYILSAFDSGNNLQSLISPLSMLFSLCTIFGSLLVLLGLPGMYTRQAKQAGILGLLGFLFLWYVTLFQGIMIPFTNVTFIPMLAAHQVAPQLMITPPPTWTPFSIVSMVSEVLGILLLAIATLRARVFPRWIGWMLVATLVLGVVNLSKMNEQSARISVSTEAANTRLTGFKLITARTLWLVLVLPSLGLTFVSILLYYQQIQKPCVDATTCNIAGAMTAKGLRALADCLFSRDFRYRAYYPRAIDLLPDSHCTCRPHGPGWADQPLVVLAALSKRTAGSALDGSDHTAYHYPDHLVRRSSHLTFQCEQLAWIA